MRSLRLPLVLASCSALALGAALDRPVRAQTPSAPSPAEVEALLERMQQQLERLSEAAAERDRALEFLEKQIEAATGRLAATGQTAESLKSSKAELETRLETLASDRAQLQARLQSLEDERARTIADLTARLERLAAQLSGVEAERAGLGERLAVLERERESERARTAALARELEAREARIRELEARLGERESELGLTRAEVERLNRVLGATTDQLRRVAAALERSEAEVDRQKLLIDELGARLNAALLQRVEQLEEYRSEFFGRLRRILGDRPEVVIVGDRFVFQAEVLFPSGSARLQPEGEAQLRRLAATLREVAARIPRDIDWVLRVDGHTDRRPVGPGSPFRSNWELSTARAISVVEFLIREGIPPERLVAAGFGEFRPLDPADTELAWRRNRRIEFKLTER
ncbi:MAG: peptidoglycan -binding protein [Geminicoccaceae bacterium]|nr:peptidoglycan -binding protein [Geminicoccaceae bacterium]MCX7629414.1 peptidoglycan -binding protein [Geminicoccaceae bacterium]MDW8125000.1 peptidoglycan -binding protein [Geminicoccaceae bacterium]